LEDIFEAVAISEEMGFKKPDPRAFHHALAQLRTAPAEAIFVGDDPVSDIAGAQAVGMIAVQVGGRRRDRTRPRARGVARDVSVTLRSPVRLTYRR
jgi:FMN phosphatase YigB (HAD superfamily)